MCDTARFVWASAHNFMISLRLKRKFSTLQPFATRISLSSIVSDSTRPKNKIEQSCSVSAIHFKSTLASSVEIFEPLFCPLPFFFSFFPARDVSAEASGRSELTPSAPSSGSSSSSVVLPPSRGIWSSSSSLALSFSPSCCSIPDLAVTTAVSRKMSSSTPDAGFSVVSSTRAFTLALLFLRAEGSSVFAPCESTSIGSPSLPDFLGIFGSWIDLV